MAQHGRAAVGEPRILAIENATPCGSVAVVCPDLCLAEASFTTSVSHSRRLLGTIQQVMEQAATDWAQLNAIAVSAGPGSFTGLRIGLSTAKAMAMATGLPLLSVTSTRTLACQILDSRRLICPVLDARKGEVYTALYRRAGRDLTRLSAIAALHPRQLLTQLGSEEVIFVGDGIRIHGRVWGEALGERASFADPGLFFPRAAALGQAAMGKWATGDFLDPATGVPDYIRPSEAELMLASQPSSSGPKRSG